MSVVNKLMKFFAGGAAPAVVAAEAADVPPAPVVEKLVPPEGPRLNLGCGFDVREGWVNIDMHDWHKPDIVADVTDLAVLDDNSAGYALAQDILEHIHRARCSTALREWNRVLMMGGILEVRSPDVIALANLMQHDPNRQTPEAHAVLLQCMFGTQTYNGDFHYNGFTEISIRHAFAEAGFEVVLLDHQDQWNMMVTGRKIAHTPPEPMLRLPSHEAFLREAYRAALGREADDEGFAHFLGKLDDGAPRETVLETLRHARKANPEGHV